MLSIFECERHLRAFVTPKFEYYKCAQEQELFSDCSALIFLHYLRQNIPLFPLRLRNNLQITRN